MKNRPLLKILSLALAMLLAFSALPAVSYVHADDDVDRVAELLSGIDSLQEMQDRRSEFRVSSAYKADDPNSVAEHKAAQEGYASYVLEMNEKRLEAKKAYDALTDSQQAALDESLVRKLTDEIGPEFIDRTYQLFPTDSEYNWQMVQISASEYLGYELSQHWSIDKDMPCTLIITDASGSETSFKLDGPYEYGTNNYELTYCCDELTATAFGGHYKRVNLEDCDYYNSNQAAHIRSILMSVYPFLTIDEMKENLKAGGFAYADDLSTADIVAGVQFAIWYYSNKMTNDLEQLRKDTSYGGTSNAIEFPGNYTLISSVNDYRNELWYWWDSNPRFATYYSDLEERVMALRDYLIALPPTQASGNTFVISSIDITRTDMIPGEDNTYDLDLAITLNHGAKADDDVVLKVSAFSTAEDGTVILTEEQTVVVDEKTESPLTIRARCGDTVKVVASGEQELEKAVYFYEPEGGYEASQALVGISEGRTKVRTESSFLFKKDIEAGIRIYKTETDTNKPVKGAVFDIYSVAAEEGTVYSDTPSEEEIARFAVDANRVAVLTTDESGYASAELERGTYLLIEREDQSVTKQPVAPLFFTLPVRVEKQNDDGTIEAVYEDIASLKLKNAPPDEPGSVSVNPEVTKAINDWGPADRFDFTLEAVTKDAPMPKNAQASATEDAPVASFGPIVFFEPGTYEYTITEADGGVKGVTYDTAHHSLVVTVTQVEGTLGELEADVKYDGKEALTITNTFKPLPATAVPEVEKSINDWTNTDEFEFTFAPVTENAPMPKNTSAFATEDAPVASFGEIVFEEPGTYEYTITEIDGGVKGVTYDTDPHSYVVVVSEDPDDPGQLVAKAAYDGGDKLIITNHYEPDPPPTGEKYPVWLLSALLLLSLASCAALLLKRRA